MATRERSVPAKTRYAEVVRALLDGTVEGVEELTMAEVLAASGLERSYLNGVIYGSVGSPRVDKMRQIAKGFGVDPKWLRARLAEPLGAAIPSTIPQGPDQPSALWIHIATKMLSDAAATSWASEMTFEPYYDPLSPNRITLRGTSRDPQNPGELEISLTIADHPPKEDWFEESQRRARVVDLQSRIVRAHPYSSDLARGRDMKRLEELMTGPEERDVTGLDDSGQLVLQQPHQEVMGQDHQGHVVVPAAPEAALVVVQAQLVLALGEAALNGPAHAAGPDQGQER
jgi:transcriptional regulator with XRE-family HTH domain